MEEALAEKYAPIHEDVLDDPLKWDGDFIEIFDDNYEKFDFWDVEDLIKDIYNKPKQSHLDEFDEQTEELNLEYETEESEELPYELRTIDDDEHWQNYLIDIEHDSLDSHDNTKEGEASESEPLEEVLDKDEESPDTQPESEDLVKQLLSQILF